jgi:hypothetical protein
MVSASEGINLSVEQKRLMKALKRRMWDVRGLSKDTDDRDNCSAE